MSTAQHEDPNGTVQEAPLLERFEAVDYRSLRQELRTFQETSVALQSQWRREMSLYEQTIDKVVGNTAITLPRRNYPNEHNEVQDPRLYPYHSSCYYLLDAYNALYGQQQQEEALSGSSTNASIGRLRFGDAHAATLSRVDLPENVLPCSRAAIDVTFFDPEWRVPQDNDDFLFAKSLNEGANERLQAACIRGSVISLVEREAHDLLRQRPHPSPIPELGFGRLYFPTSDNEKTELLLKLLRHAMSEIQRDHLLATAVLRLFIRWKLCDRPAVLRQLLSIFVAERVACDGQCEHRADFADDASNEGQRPDHSCDEWCNHFLPVIAALSWQGITCFTAKHADIASAAVQERFDEAFAAAAKVEESLFNDKLGLQDNQSISSKQKTLLKRNLAYKVMNDDDDDESDSAAVPRNLEEHFPYLFVTRLVVGLGYRAMLDRQTVFHLQRVVNGTSVSPKEKASLMWVAQRSVDSYFNALRTLVHIGELAVRRLPNNQETMTLFGSLVRSLVFAYVEPPLTEDDAPFDSNFLRQRVDTLRPMRYAEKIANATELARRDAEIRGQASSGIDRVVYGRPPKDVVDLIRGLFARDLVDIDASTLGYGDYICLLKLPLSAQDPLLFFQSYNTAELPGEDDPRDSDGDELPNAAVHDEDGVCLNAVQLNARYDLTLVLFLRAWQAPWTPESHQSFHGPFRQAATSLFLCSHRLGMPFEIARLVCEYLRRDWWEDDRSQCWCSECLCSGAVEQLQRNALNRVESYPSVEKHCNSTGAQRNTSIFRCPRCHIPHYCSREHQQVDYQAGHSLQCSKPPFRAPGKEEHALCQQILEAHSDVDLGGGLALTNESFAANQSIAEGLVKNDDDSWESFDDSDENATDEAEQNSITHIVTQWFKAKAYECSNDGSSDDDEGAIDES